MTQPSSSPLPALDERGLPAGYAFHPEWEVTPRQVKSRLDGPDPRPIVMDCRRPDEWALGRLPGAVHIPMDQVAARLEELETDDGGRERPVVVYCHHGGRSMRVTALLRQHGFSGAVSMTGGIDLWSIDVDPAIPRY
jgi:rhodanese-related sulfurtransferase